MRRFIRLICLTLLVGLSSCALQDEVIAPGRTMTAEERLRFSGLHKTEVEKAKARRLRNYKPRYQNANWQHQKVTRRGKGGVRVLPIKRYPRWRRVNG